jgi:tetratricopeptide (TPR) repeat protein
MVLDNADDVNMFIDTNSDTSSTLGLHRASDDPLIMYLPDAERGRILITTRDTGAALNFTGSEDKIIQIKPMSIADAKFLMYRKLDQYHSSDPDVERLVALLGALPLALTQAASYINTSGRRMTLDKYITLLTTTQLSGLKLLEREIQDDRRDASQSGSIVTTWQISFDHIKQRNPGACELLCFMAMLDCQCLPRFLLSSFAPDELDLEDYLSLLIQFSFTTQGESEGLFKIHFLVALAVRRWLTSRNEYEKWNSRALKILSKSFPGRVKGEWIGKEVFEDRNKFLPHVHRVLQYFSTEREDLLCRASLLLCITEDALGRQCFQQHPLEAVEALELRQQLLGENHILTAEAHAILGRVRKFEGDFETSKRHLEIAQRIALTDTGAENILKGDIALYLAELLASLDQTKEAESLIRQTMDARRKAFGDNHSATLHSMEVLGLFYQGIGQYSDAEIIQRASVNTCQKLFGRSHPSTLCSILDLVLTYLLSNSLSQAESYLDTMDRILEASESEPHIKIGIALCRLFQGFLRQDVPKTLNFVDYMMKGLSVEFGVDSTVFCVFSKLAIIVWADMDHVDDAKCLAGQLYSNMGEKLGNDHPQTLEAMLSLAEVLTSGNENLQAEALTQQALTLSRARHGNQHPVTLQLEKVGSEILMDTGKYEPATQLANHAYSLRRETMGHDHFRTVEALNSLAAVYLAREDYTTAEQKFVQVVEGYRKIHGFDHPFTVRAIGNLIRCVRPPERATQIPNCENYADLAVKFWDTRLGAEHRETIKAEYNQIVVKQGLERYDEGAKLAAPLLEKQRRVLPQDDSLTLMTMSSLACCYSFFGEVQERRGAHTLCSEAP